MPAPYSSGRKTPTLTNPIPASWEQLCALSSRPGEMPPERSAEAAPEIRPAPAAAAPAPASSAFRTAESERREPSFRVPDFRTAVPKEETDAFFAPPPPPTRPAAAPQAPQPRPRPQAEVQRPRPARETYFSAEPQPVVAKPSSERDETVELLQAAIERAVLEEIRPALQAAARRAAAELEADALRLAAPAVRDAVAREFARFMRK